MSWTRRHFVVAALGSATLSLGGCTGLFMDHSLAEDPWSDENRQSGIRSEAVEVDTSLPEGTYAFRTFNMNRGVQVEYQFDNDTSNPLEILFFQRDQLEDFQNGSEIIHQDSLHDAGVDPAASGSISAANWLMAVVNSDFGSIPPEGDVEGTLTIAARA